MFIFRIYPIYPPIPRGRNVKRKCALQAVAGLMLATMLLSACAAPTAGQSQLLPQPPPPGARPSDCCPSPRHPGAVATANRLPAVVRLGHRQTGNSGYWQERAIRCHLKPKRAQAECANFRLPSSALPDWSNITEEINMVESAI